MIDTRIRLTHLISLAFLTLTICMSLPERLRPVAAAVLAHGGKLSGSAQEQTTEASQVTVHAAGRGNPWIKLGDGVDMHIEYSQASALKHLADQGQVTPLALASADFDEDGTPDLVSGYATSGTGFFTFLRGNVDSIYPNSPEAQQRRSTGEFADQPFLSPARVFELPEAPDFLAAGDFDADGHWDIVAAARQDNALYLLAGDGHGNLAAPKRIELPGQVTALATGEVNRADGLTDIVVGVATASGPKALVFESPEGALQGKAEELDLPSEVSAIALGNLDDEYTMDVAVTAGSELMVVYGRDRKLSLDETQQSAVAEARVARRTFPFELRGVAIGDFNGDQKIGLSVLGSDGSIHLLTANPKKATKKKNKNSIESWKDTVLASGGWQQARAIVRARISSIPSDDLIVLDPSNRRLGIVVSNEAAELKGASLSPVALEAAGAPWAVMPMRLNADALSDLVVLMSDRAEPSIVMTRSGAVVGSSGAGATDFSPAAAFTVTNTNDSGAGSFRQAIIDANANPGLDTISFAIGTGPQTITPLSGLPAITDPVVIDATTQPGFAGSPIIELSGGSAASSVGLNITAGNSALRGLVINRFFGGINLQGSGNSLIEGNFIGTDITGTADLGNAFEGVSIGDSISNTIGGMTAAARNVISGNDQDGIRISNNSTGNLVQGDLIGTNANGTAVLPNSESGVALFIGAPSNNTIGGATAGAGNVISGNSVDGVTIFAPGNLVQGNLIGPDITGGTRLGNGGGVRIQDIASTNNTIGGTTPGARNVISGNIEALGIFSPANVVQGNFIGTDISGTTNLGNNSGIRIQGTTSSNNIVGGMVSGARNVISANNANGIVLFGGSQVIQGNFIGTNSSGNAALGNTASGIFISSAAGNVIGPANVISGNGGSGVNISGSAATGNQISGNFIGTDVTGNSPLGNGLNGVLLNGAPGNTLDGNLISGNNNVNGVLITNGASANQVRGNLIGTNASGTAAIPNLGSGVRIIGSSNNSVVGNLLSGNGAVGVNILAGAVTSNGNVVQGNLIGTDATGNSALGNSGSGIQVTGANNRVGGTTTAARNVISGNGAFGISMFAGSLGGTPFATNGNEVQGNYIGSNSAGTGPVGNALGGISIQASGGSSASNNVVGSAGGASNLIAFNGGDGVTLSTADASPLSGNLILSNSIYSNAGLGIDLTAAFPTDGPTPNDPCDADAGPNNLQNSPVLTSAFASAGVTTIQGTLNSTPNTTFTIQVFSNTECDPSGSGEGETLLGSTTVTTDSSCSGSFKFTTNKPVAGQVFAATATDPAGNTSEFSPCVALGAALADVSLTMSASTTTPKPGDKVTYTITVTNNGPEIANNVVVTDNLPDHLSFASCASTGGGVCGGTGNSRMVTFPLMATNASATITFEATVNSSVANGTRIDNTATVTSAASDPIASNNTATASLTVSTNPISINCPANVSVTAAQGQTSAVVNYSSPTVVGNPPGVTLTCSPPSGSNFPLGTTTVNCTATDAANNKGSCGFTVTVNPFVPNNPSPDKTAIDFGSPLVLPLQTPTSDTFAITNTATASVDLTFASIRRTGGDVSAGKITNPDDSGLFSVFAVNPGSADTQLNVGAIVTIPAGQRSFRVMFNPAVPPVAPRTSNLAANQVLPDVVTSTLNFTTGDGRTLTINLTGRVSTALQLIDPVDTSRPPDVTFTKSGNQFTLTYSVFDSNQDVSRASYQFLDSSGQPAGQPIEVILAQALQPLGLARGQSFTVEQPFSGASSHPEIAGVRVTVFDVETNVSATATLGAAAASVTGAAREQRVTLVLPRRRLHRLTP